MFFILVNVVLFLALLKIIALVTKPLSRNKYSGLVNGQDKQNPYFTIGFFHPFCHSGGGGERVLWSAVKALQDYYPNCVCVIYTGDKVQSPSEFLDKAYERFTIKLDPNRTKFVGLRLRFLVLDKYYPMFTLLGQSVGSLVLAIEAFVKFIPDIYFETTGYAFTYPLYKHIANVPVCCYTHYPTISTDMLEIVTQQVPRYNNRRLISQSVLLTKCKMVYYQLFAKMYSWCGRCSDCVMVNSSWTQAHINNLWSLAYKTRTIYPPCDVNKLEPVFSDKRHDENFYIASVAQIRPEKNHQLQIRALAKFLEKVKQSGSSVDNIKLMLIGSCRNEEDFRRVQSLEELAQSLKVDDKVEFKLNFTFDNLLISLAESAVGIHSMIDEHFGIGVVECMAAGTIIVAHNSAGPKMDIVVPYKGEKTGFLAESEDDYCEALYQIYTMSPKKRSSIREAAREHVKKFSQEKFNVTFIEAFNTLCFDEYINRLRIGRSENTRSRNE